MLQRDSRHHVFKHLARSLLSFIVNYLWEYCERSAFRERTKHEKKLQAIDRANWNYRLPAHTPVENLLDVYATSAPNPQLQSPFFGKLPRELRDMIYAYALGGQELQCEITNLPMLVYRHHANNTGVFKLRCRDAQALFGFPGSCKVAYVCEVSSF
jgi:hypothetical protein